MKNCNIKESVNMLLHSNISISTISDKTGVSKAHLTNLRNGTKDLSNASFDTVEKLFRYYLEQKEYIETGTDEDKAIRKVKIPKDIQLFISGLQQTIDNINDTSSNVNINNIVVERIFTLSKDNRSVSAVSQLTVNQLIPIKMKNEAISYNLAIASSINQQDYLADEIKNFTITFKQDDLELMLKQLIYKGAKVKLIKSFFNHSDSYNTGIYIDLQQDEIFKYESSFINIKINEENKEGSEY
ncbi:hypothetical protein NGB25_12840 [Staphylococcus saprophyticus]|uniref:hypothetical protein n=1 Tax=Staphylococcus saprophyticus TaxID=29385 RepID=UPI002DBDB0A8|nr:hypothetical protein [Staphylococcus saprophyticus]MEB7677987.1 hypothetical protein [Staphylococcus saprophyticus]